MDIPVSRLNQRMALQLPAELPLGLVFVVGQVQVPNQSSASSEARPGEFYLDDAGYRLPCRLSERAAAEFRLQTGVMVRAGGHLVFEPALASYYLLARDIERLDGFRPATKPLTAIIADSSRRERAATLAPADLPPWVKRMAPPEAQPLQDEDRLPAALGQPAPSVGGNWELLADAEAAVAYPEAEPALAGLSDELIAFLSKAMDSPVEVEITPDIMVDLNTSGKTERLSPEVLEALDLFEDSVRGESAGEPARQPAAEQQPATWSELGADGAAAGGKQPLGEAITAAEFAEALETARLVEPPGPSAQPPSPTKAPPVAAKDQANRSGQSSDIIPWYVALPIIVAMVLLLAAILYLALFARSLPLDLSVNLPQGLPLLN